MISPYISCIYTDPSGQNPCWRGENPTKSKCLPRMTGTHGYVGAECNIIYLLASTDPSRIASPSRIDGQSGFALRLLDVDQRDPWSKDENHPRPSLSLSRINFPIVTSSQTHAGTARAWQLVECVALHRHERRYSSNACGLDIFSKALYIGPYMAIRLYIWSLR